MLQFRGFLIYDLKRSIFFFEMRRDIELDPKWFAFQKDVRKKLNEQDVLEDKVLEMSNVYGKIRGKFDDFQKRFLILITQNSVEDIYLAELLNEIFSILIVQEHYIKFFKEELEALTFFEVEKIIQKKEYYLIQNFHSMLAPNLFSQISDNQKLLFSNDVELQMEVSKQSGQCAKEQIIFKGFTIFDTQRQCFYMLIKRGFENDDLWKMQRTQIQQYLLKRSKDPLQHFFLNYEMGQFLFEYDNQAKNYFILLTDSTSSQHPQYQLLSKLKALVQKIPNYQKLNKPQIENLLKSNLVEVMEAEERIYYQKYYPNWIEEEKKINRQILRQRGMTQISFQDQGTMYNDEFSLTDYASQRVRFVHDFYQ
ncbi:unnamed protein product [Paramecium octaurelia]|uniref:Uncharacterized protein n=1 Tax=Paramecium octaurelia TaxID=43137 RepID=A0A8S1YF99_PAROT|nr:unnamed protein product [Paramecium octaurelia]